MSGFFSFFLFFFLLQKSQGKQLFEEHAYYNQYKLKMVANNIQICHLIIWQCSLPTQGELLNMDFMVQLLLSPPLITINSIYWASIAYIQIRLEF